MNNNPVSSPLTPEGSWPRSANASAEVSLLRKYIEGTAFITRRHRTEGRGDFSAKPFKYSFDEKSYRLSSPIRKILGNWLYNEVEVSTVTIAAKAWVCHTVNKYLEDAANPLRSPYPKTGASPKCLRSCCESAVQLLEQGGYPDSEANDQIRLLVWSRIKGDPKMAPPEPLYRSPLEDTDREMAVILLKSLAVVLEFRSALWEANRKPEGLDDALLPSKKAGR